MRISNNISPSFGIKFINNAAYRDVKRYAIKNGYGEEFKQLTEKLEKIADGNVEIQFGIDKDGRHFSTFTLRDITVENTPYDGETGIEVTYRCMKNLALLGGRFKTLIGTNYIKTRAGV